MTVLITGTSRGIGRYLAEKYLALGWTVIGCSRKSTDFHEDNYYHSFIDVSNESNIMSLFSFIKQFSPIDLVLNNAGTASMNHSLLMTGKKAKEIMETNFIGTFLVCREAAKIMINQPKGGKIVNFSSKGVCYDLAGEAVYLASKSAVETLTNIMSKELPKKIEMKYIRIGFTDTDLTKNIKCTIPRNTFEDIYDMINETA